MSAAESSAPGKPRSWLAETASMLAARTSIAHFLAVLTLIPAVSLPIFGGLFIQDRQRISSDAARVEKGLADIAGLDRLQGAVRLEAQAQLKQSAVAFLHLTPSQRVDLGSGDFTRLMKDRLATTDAALAQMRGSPFIAVPAGRTTIETIGRRIAAARSAVEALQESTATTGLTVLLPVASTYTDIASVVEKLERTAIYQALSGQLGASSSPLLRATGQIHAVADLSLQFNLLQNQYTNMLMTGTTPAALAALATSTGGVDTLSAQLDQFLSAKALLLWTNLQADPRLASYLGDVRSLVAVGYRGEARPVTSPVAAAAASANAGMAVSGQLSHLMAVSIADTVAIAHHDQVTAGHRARMGLFGVLLALAATITLLVLIGGKIRRRLSELADSAQRLSAGRLELMAVRGPREMAFVSRGLNDAVQSLRDISLKADLVSRGDIRSPLLERPSPGPLGAAMEASFQQVVMTMRERELLQDELAHQATHDRLTGLANRAEAERRLMEAVREPRTRANRIGLLFVDLDHFKACNDTYGHHAGDHVLGVCAQRMVKQLRNDDVACRLGGDEFVIILNNVTHAEAVTTGERIVSALREPITYMDHELDLSASVGITVWPDDEADSMSAAHHTEVEVAALAELILADADRALYRAKALGRGVAAL